MKESQTELGRLLLAMLASLRQFAIDHAAYASALQPVIKARYASGGSQGVETLRSAIDLDRIEAVLVGRLRAEGFSGVLDTRRVSPMTNDVVEQVLALIEHHVRAQSAHAHREEV